MNVVKKTGKKVVQTIANASKHIQDQVYSVKKTKQQTDAGHKEVEETRVLGQTLKKKETEYKRPMRKIKVYSPKQEVVGHAYKFAKLKKK